MHTQVGELAVLASSRRAGRSTRKGHAHQTKRARVRDELTANAARKVRTIKPRLQCNVLRGLAEMTRRQI
eukprot:1179866-Prorocentrum_minimum.AAC.4